MLVGDVVRDDVDDRADAERAGLGDQPLGLLEGPERRVDRAVVGDVVAAVGHRRRVPGVEPERVDAEVAQVGQPLEDAGEVADPVAVRVREAPDVHLVDDRVTPPLLVGEGLTVRGLRVELQGGPAGRRRRCRAGHARSLADLASDCKISTEL